MEASDTPDFGTMTIKQLKEYITRRGRSHVDCVEKSELLERARECSQIDTFTCAVCLEDETQFALMPCCHTADSTICFCQRCIGVIVARGDGVGRCPRCRGYVKIDQGPPWQVVITTHQATCLMCRQQKVIVDEGKCDQCLLGARFSFTYTCQRCGNPQRIPHPMWRYQISPTAYGNNTWACHQQCGDYTNWRVIPEDAERIPPEECPESWGRQEEWLAQVREASLEQRLNPQLPPQGGRCAQQ